MTTRRSIEGSWLSLPVFNASGVFFWCAGFVVRLRYTFFLASVFISLSSHRDVWGVLSWLVASALGVLLHELGHAFAARRYGAQPVIELYTMGGVTSFSWPRHPQWTQSVIVSLAGPGIGIILGLGLGYVSVPVDFWWLADLVDDLRWVTLVWSLFNLLPILPMDGAAALESVLGRFWGADRARRQMRYISVGVGALAAFVFFGSRMPIAGVMCALFAYNNAQALRGMPGVRISG